MSPMKWAMISLYAFVLVLSRNLPGEQALTATAGSAAGQALTVSAAQTDLDLPPVVVRAKRTTARPLPDWLKKKLNAPLVPTPTVFEKKIAPTVQTAKALWEIGIFAAILAGGIAKGK